VPETPDEELVRRLLADARHDEPVPADVAAHLDAVLADLAGPRVPEGVTPLRAPQRVRRRRWGVALVAAAAAVTAIAVAPRIGSPGGGSDDSTASDSAGASSSRSAGGKSLDEGPAAQAAGVALLHRDTLAADVRAARARLAASPHALQSQGPESLAPGCGADDRGPGSALAARLDGRDVVLVLRPPAGGRQVADVLACGTARVLASVTLPAP